MSFGEWYVRRGRINRRTWWLHYTLPLMAVGVVATVVDTVLGFAPPESESIYTYVGGPVSILFTLLTIPPSISATVTRLHDIGHSAWWLLLCLVPVLGWLVLFVQNGFLAGQVAGNRYGPPPGVVPAVSAQEPA